MDDKIFTMAGDQLHEIIAEPFKTEEELQKLIAEHPKLLAWEQMNPGGSMDWILVRREMGIAQDVGAGDRWAVDHLFIDQDAVPTLVEVKRRDNPELRRKVVGQMLEYAAHAWQTWTADGLRQTFEGRCRGESIDPNKELSALLDEREEADEFWARVGDNLAAKRLRLLFVADDIPDELTRVVEFLNATMPSVEVLAVEIKKFDGHGIRALVPRLIGRTAKAAGARTHKLDHDSFLAKFEDEAVRNAVASLLQVGIDHGRIYYGTTGVSIWYPIQASTKRCSVAWIYPPGVSGWMGLTDFTFGCPPFKDVPAELHEVLRKWLAQLEEDGLNDVSGGWGNGKRVVAGDVAKHIDTLAARLKDVLTNLRTLEAPHRP